MAVPFSGLVLMFGNMFVEEKRRGKRLPCLDVNVGIGDLACTALTAAFIDLEREGMIRLSIGRRRASMGLREPDTIIVERIKDPEAPMENLEGHIHRFIVGEESEDNVYEIVCRIIGSDKTNPHGYVTRLIEESLVNQGCFEWEEKKKKVLWKKITIRKLVPNCERISELKWSANEVKVVLDQFKNQKGHLYSQLYQDVEKGIASKEYTY